VNFGYDFSLVGEAARSVMSVSPGRRRKAMLVIETLAADPFLEPDLEEHGPSGRRYSILLRENILITYWVDHAIKELRILRIEFD
jgi:hypothetical protein